MSFTRLGLDEPLLHAIKDKGYTKPSPVQQEAIPAILEGRDVMAAAQTGTGKTAGFTLPILQRLSAGRRADSNNVRALILTPTRELAAQIEDSVVTYGKYLPLKSCAVFGGVKINPQMKRLRGGVDILVATPGRLLDLYSQNAVKFSQLEVLVLDEADRMLDMGFIRDIKKIISLLPAKRQNLLFSATFAGSVGGLIDKLLHNPIKIEVSPKNAAAESVKQAVFEVDKSKKTALITHLIRDNNWDQVLVFMRTKHGANRLTKKLDKAGVSAKAIHGNKSQGARTRALADFKASKVRVLVATDIAARGIDIRELPHVINFELPNVPEDYVHRIGRTGRAGSEGEAISLVSADEVDLLAAIEQLIRKTLVREQEPGFVPEHNVPLTDHTRMRKKPKKPKKPKNRGQNNSARTNAGNKNRSSRGRGLNKNRNASNGKANSGNPRSGNRNQGRRSRKPAQGN